MNEGKFVSFTAPLGHRTPGFRSHERQLNARAFAARLHARRLAAPSRRSRDGLNLAYRTRHSDTGLLDKRTL